MPVNVTSVLAMRLISGCHGEIGAIGALTVGVLMMFAVPDGDVVVVAAAVSTLACSPSLAAAGGCVTGVTVDGGSLTAAVPPLAMVWPKEEAAVTGLPLAGLGCVVVDDDEALEPKPWLLDVVESVEAEPWVTDEWLDRGGVAVAAFAPVSVVGPALGPERSVPALVLVTVAESLCWVVSA